MKLTYELILGLSIMTIFVVISGVTGILATNAIHKHVETVTKITSPTVQVVDNTIIAIAQMDRVLQAFSSEYNENNLEDLRSEFDSLNQQIIGLQADALKLIDDANLLENLHTADKKYATFKEKATNMMAAHRNEFTTKESGERERYKSVKDALTKQLNDEATDLISLFKEIGTRVNTFNKKADEESVYAVQTTYIILIITTLLSLTCAGAIAIFLGRSILMPVNELSEAASKVSTGNFEVSVKESYANNELRQLTNTFNKMVASLRGMIEESPRLKQFMDITPLAEKTSTKPEKFTIAAGASYLLKETPTKRAYEIFVDKVTHGYQGLCITRMSPEVVKKQYDLQKTPILWLSDIKDTKVFSSSDTLLISKLVIDFIAKAEKSIILLDRIDYLIAKHGFQEVLKLIIQLNDRAMVNNAILIVPVDPSLLKAEEFTFLEKELQFLPESREKLDLQPDLVKILNLIANRRMLGRSVTFKDIAQELGITAPTTQRRVVDLYNRGLITIVKQGRNKLLQLTPEGERAWSKKF